MNDIMSVKEVAQMFGVHPETVRIWLRSGRLVGRRVGLKWFIAREDVEALLKGGIADGEESKGSKAAASGSSSVALSQSSHREASAGRVTVRIIE